MLMCRAPIGIDFLFEARMTLSHIHINLRGMDPWLISKNVSHSKSQSCFIFC